MILLLLAFLVAAYVTKPSDKDCIIAAVEGVWRERTPNKEKFPQYFEQFMDVTSTMVKVDDWLFLKRMRYRFGPQYRTVGYGAFTKIFMLTDKR